MLFRSLHTPRTSFAGTVEDMSLMGVRVRFPFVPSESLAGSHLELSRVTLKVNPVSMTRRSRKTYIHFTVESIERGKQHWHTLHQTEWRRQ